MEENKAGNSRKVYTCSELVLTVRRVQCNSISMEKGHIWMKTQGPIPSFSHISTPIQWITSWLNPTHLGSIERI
jgi:hypothetical protein